MSNISASLQRKINTIDELAGGTVENQISACKNHLCTEFYHDGYLKDGVDKSINAIFLPFIIRGTASDNVVLQQEGAYFLDAICSTPDRKKHTKLVINAGAIPKLIHNLSSSKEPFVLDQTLQCLGKIAARYPRDVIEMNILPSLNVCLKSTDRQVFFHAVKCFAILSTIYKEEIPDILVAHTVESLLKVVETDVNGTSVGNRYSLVGLLSSSASSDHDALKPLKDIFEWLLAEKSKVDKDVALHKSSERKIIKLLAINFIKSVISHGGIDAIFSEDFIFPILQNINAPSTFKEIKPKCIKSIEDIISVKHDSAATLVKVYDIITLLCSNLGSSTEDLRITTLRVLKKIIQMFENEEDKVLCRQKIRSCDDDLKKLTKLRKDIDGTIRELSNSIYYFVNNASAAEVSGDNQNDANDSPAAVVIERPQTRRQRPSSKRPANTNVGNRLAANFKRLRRPATSERPSTRRKRSRISSEQTNTEQSTSNNDEENDGNDWYNDIDDHPASFSDDNLDTVTTDGNDRSSNNPNGSSPPAHLSPTIPSSNVTPALPESAATNDGLNLNVTMHLAATVPLVNLSGHNPSVRIGTSAATPTGRIQNSLNFAEPLPSNNSSSSSLSATPVLPHPPSTDTVTTPQSNRVIKSSPPSDNSVTSSSRALPNNSHDLSALPSTGNIPNNTPQGQPASSNQSTSPASSDLNANANNFITVKYRPPSEETIDEEYCRLLRIKFNPKAYYDFIGKIEFRHIRPHSEPIKFYTPIDKTGAGCFSVYLTGDENNAQQIRDKIDAKFADNLRQPGELLNREELNRITEISKAAVMLPEHFQTIAAWLNCRIMIYSYGKWEKYGNFDSIDDKTTPLFVLAKNEINEKITKIEYHIVLGFKNV